MKLHEGVNKLTNAEYIDIARNDPTWREIVASFAIEGMLMTEDNEIVAGKMIVGEISLVEATRIIRSNAGVPVQAGQVGLSE